VNCLFSLTLTVYAVYAVYALSVNTHGTGTTRIQSYQRGICLALIHICSNVDKYLNVCMHVCMCAYVGFDTVILQDSAE
jgi:hypothetical protein